ncbi:MAG TPA: hypothetical protein VGX68_28285, partial [Thermoanaerobaculia bacterium]|nr:hypothetical protein [Thermoanaerobaculia bacterium]
SPPYRIEPLGAHHNRAAFSSGVEPLDRYLRAQAGQDSRRRVASCFILTRADEPAQVLGYYTLSALSIALSDLPSSIVKRGRQPADVLAGYGDRGSLRLSSTRTPAISSRPPSPALLERGRGEVSKSRLLRPA